MAEHSQNEAGPALQVRSPAQRSDIFTIVAIAIVAYALDDLVHEAIGHGLAALMVPDVHVLSLSSVALQTTRESRIVAAAGSIANVLAGAAALALLHRRHRFSTAGYFLWLFGSMNLMNGSGDPLFSAVLGYGDWEVVIRGPEPAAMWRIGLGIAGAVAYVGVIIVSANELARGVKGNLVSCAEIPRLVFVAYVAGGVLMLAAAAFNPISSSLILLSGLSSGFAAMAGLTFISRMVE